MGIRFKLMLPLLMASAIFIAILHLYLAPTWIADERDLLIKQQQNLIVTLKPEIIRFMLAGDYASLYSVLDDQLHIMKETWRQLILVSAEGERIYPLVEAEPLATNEKDMMLNKYAIEIEGRLLAYLMVSTDWSSVSQHAFSRVRDVEKFLYLILGLLFLFSLTWQSALIRIPLERLERAATSLANGDFSVSIPLLQDDEIGRLSRAFNTMRDSLREHQQELRETANEARSAEAALQVQMRKRQRAEKAMHYDLMVKKTFNAALETAMGNDPLSVKLEKILELVLDASWLSTESRGSIFFADEGGQTLTLMVQRGLAAPLLASCANISFGQCLCGKAAASQEIIFTTCLDHRHEIEYDGIKQHGHYCVPILSSHKTLGVLNLYVEHNHPPKETEKHILKMIANLLSGIIEHERGTELVRKTLNDLDNQVNALDEHAIVSIADVYGDITYANDKFCEISQYSREELIGTNHRILKSGVHPKEFYQEQWKTISQGMVWKGEICNKKKDGTLYWVSATIVPFLDDNGIPNKYVAIRENITERKNYEKILLAKNEQLKLAHRELEQSHQQALQAEKLASVGQLAAGIAHEINTPIQFVGDNTRFLQEAFDDLLELVRVHEMLNSDDIDGTNKAKLAEKARVLSDELEVDYLAEEIPSAFNQSLEGIERVTKIVRSMKDFSHPGTEQKELIDINRAIDSTATVSRNEWKYDAELVTDFDAALSAVPCYPGELNQVILNIIVNAAHAIKDARGDDATLGTITISTRLDNDHAEIQIKDTGTGMPEAVRKRIFEPFYTTKGVGKGSGQGLAIAYSVIVDKHAGTLDVDSTPGEGTTFIIRLPM
ncbi:MAG: ATP-binding protein, partial [Gammaproteobacteria bacterium]